MKNILFILADCLRADLVFGEERRAPTPTLNRLKKWGLSFTQVISSATMTSPCVSALFTGCYPHFTGIHQLRGDVLNPSLPTLAELLRAHGYRTGALMTGPLWEGLGLERGFEHYEYEKPGPMLSARWRDRIREWTAPRDDPRPWFLYAHFFDLHAPRVVPPEFNRTEYGQTTYDRAVAAFDRRLAEISGALDWKNTIVVLHADHGEAFPRTAWLEFREKMWQEVVLGSKPPLLRLGLRRDPTVRAWTGLKRLTRMGHGFGLNESQVRVPLIVISPDDPHAGERVDAQVRQVDLMPTVLEWAGAAPPSNLSGRSLLPVVEDVETEVRPALMEARWFGRDPNFFLRGLRMPSWKYIDSPTDRRVKPQLYDLANDSAEKRNVLPAHPDVAAEMLRLIEGETGAGGPPSAHESWKPGETEIVEERLRNLGYF